MKLFSGLRRRKGSRKSGGEDPSSPPTGGLIAEVTAPADLTAETHQETERLSDDDQIDDMDVLAPLHRSKSMSDAERRSSSLKDKDGPHLQHYLSEGDLGRSRVGAGSRGSGSGSGNSSGAGIVRLEPPEEKRPFVRCIDSCCWLLGIIFFVLAVLAAVYYFLPHEEALQALQEALGGGVDPPGVVLAREGLRAKHPVVFVPGIVTGEGGRGGGGEEGEGDGMEVKKDRDSVPLSVW